MTDLLRHIHRKPWPPFTAWIAASSLLHGCTLMPAEDLQPPKPLEIPQSEAVAAGSGQLAAPSAAENIISRTRQIERLPVSAAMSGTPVTPAPRVLFPPHEAASYTLSVDGLPLPAFINEVFANQLALNFQIAPEVADKKDLVTLRVTHPRNRQGLFDIARQVLDTYGVRMIEQGDLFRFVLGTDGSLRNEPPLIVSGQALPSVPTTHRPVFLVRDMKVISNADAYGMLRAVFEGQDLRIERENSRNALRIQGKPDLVLAASNILDSMDTPLMRGQYSLRIQPAFTDAQTLSERLLATLKAQGYDIGNVGSNTVLVPVNAINSLFVFAPNEQILQAVTDWTRQLDVVAAQPHSSEGLYWYRVRNTSAAQLADILNAAVSGGEAPATASSTLSGTGNSAGTDNKAGTANRTNTARAPQTSARGSFVVDAARNMLLYKGEAERWQQLLPLVRELDEAPPQVLIEVVVAEVTLNEDFRFGIEWAMSQISANGAGGPLTSVFGSGVPGSGLEAGGLSWSPISSSGQTRLALNAFASDNRVSILQTPRILVRSGESASVNVGTEVPVITRQSNTPDQTIEGTSPITQEIQYRSTGVSLNVTPTVYSDGRIDLEISQEVSEAAQNQTSNVGSPTIFTRNLETRLSLQDGGSVLLAGLITNRQTQGDSRIPFLGKIPVIGHLFRSDRISADKTELMVLIVPYLIKDGTQAEALTKAFRDRLKLSPAVQSTHQHIYEP